MHSYVKALKTLFEQNADPSQAPGMKKYMRDQFEYWVSNRQSSGD